MPAFSFQTRFADRVEFGALIREAQAAGSTLKAAMTELRADFPEYKEIEPKFQTIRAERKDGRVPAKVGDVLSLYQGMRTAACGKLGEVRCRSVRKIQLGKAEWPMREASSDPRLFWVAYVGSCFSYEWPGDYENERKWWRRIARMDGFSSVGEMANWFERVHGMPFSGWVVRW